MTNAGKSMGEEGSFLAKYCQRYQCAAQDFEKALLWRCLYATGKPLAWVLWQFNHECFQPDLDLIAELKDSTQYTQVRDIVSFYSSQSQKKQYLRRWFRIRLSKTKLLNLAYDVLHSDAA